LKFPWVLTSCCYNRLSLSSLSVFLNGYFLEPTVGPCLCEWVFGFVWKRQGNEAKASEPDCVCVSWHLPLWESSKELRQKSQTRPCLCELVSGLVRKPDIQKNNIEGSQMALCPSDVNKKVMLTMCFSCFSVPFFKGDITKS
jgi:hypothetical protein